MLARADGSAALARSRGVDVLVVEQRTGRGYELRVIDLDTGAGRVAFRAPTDDWNLLTGRSAGQGASAGNASLPDGYVALAKAGRLAPGRGAIAIRLDDGTISSLEGATQ